MENKIDKYIKVCPNPVEGYLENDINNLKKTVEYLSCEISKLKQIIEQQKENIDKLENKNIFTSLFPSKK